MDYINIIPILYYWQSMEPDMEIQRIAAGKKPKIKILIGKDKLVLFENGRPDGQRPHGKVSYYEYFDTVKQLAKKCSKVFQLNEEDVLLLQQEIVQFHVRSLASLKGKNYINSCRDATHNLNIINLFWGGFKDREIVRYFENLRLHLFIHYQKIHILYNADKKQFQESIRYVDQGIRKIKNAFQSSSEEIYPSGYKLAMEELETWREWIEKSRQDIR